MAPMPGRRGEFFAIFPRLDRCLRLLCLFCDCVEHFPPPRIEERDGTAVDIATSGLDVGSGAFIARPEAVRRRRRRALAL